MCRHMTITYSCGCLSRSVEACPHSLSMKIAPEDCQFYFSEPIHRDERDCLSCVVRTAQRNQKKFESMELEDFHVANLKFPPSRSPPQSHPKSLGTRVLKEQEDAKGLDASYQVPASRESGEEEDEDTPRQSFSQPPTPRENEIRLPSSESQRQRPVAEPRTVPLKGESEPSTPKTLVRKMSERVKKMARRFSKKE